LVCFWQRGKGEVLKWLREGRIEGVLVVRKGKLGAPGDGAKRSWLRGEEKNMARRGRLLALKEMGLGLGFFFVFSLMFQNCPPSHFLCVL
jgi:hypothetical protein